MGQNPAQDGAELLLLLICASRFGSVSIFNKVLPTCLFLLWFNSLFRELRDSVAIWAALGFAVPVFSACGPKH